MKAVWAVCACMAAFPACTDMMETDSTTVVFEDGNRLDSPNDSLYSALGILSQVQRLGDRYVLLGELRGDLMTATTDADVDIQEVSNFSVSADNEYASFRDYYNVINNCNYALTRMDTSIVFYEDRVMVPEYVAMPSGHKLGRNYIQTALELPIYETAAKYEGPALVIHGMADRVVPYTYGERFNQVLPACRLNLIPGEDHAFSSNMPYAVSLASGWLIKTLDE